MLYDTIDTLSIATVDMLQNIKHKVQLTLCIAAAEILYRTADTLYIATVEML